MNVPSLHRLTLLSIIIHLTFFIAAIIAIKHSSRFTMPSPYIVNLVESEQRTEPRDEGGKGAAVEQTPVKSPVKEQKKEPQKSKMAKPNKKEEQRQLSEKISAMEAKKRIEKIVNLRNVISLKSTGVDEKPAQQKAGGSARGSPADDYYARISSEIRKYWIFPDIGDKNLEAIILIKILKDGTLQPRGVEKSSGNPLFDRSALRAITKASPLTPPPYEMEIGVRFYP